jgi:hypothetical protein
MQRWYLVLAMLCALAASGRAQVYWQSDFGPWGGRVNDLFEDAGGTLFAATMQGGSFHGRGAVLAWQISGRYSAICTENI